MIITSYDGQAIMAVFKTKCANAKIKVNDIDHNPPHCHVFPGGANILVDLATLEVIRPAKAKLSPSLRECLRTHRLAMLEAWENVTIDEDEL